MKWEPFFLFFECVIYDVKKFGGGLIIELGGMYYRIVNHGSNKRGIVP